MSPYFSWDTAIYIRPVLPYHSTNESMLVFEVSLTLACATFEPKSSLVRCILKGFQKQITYRPSSASLRLWLSSQTALTVLVC